MSSLDYTSFSPEQLLFLDGLRKPVDKSKGLIEASCDSIIVFAHHMLGMKLYYWEIDFLYRMQCLLDGRDVPDVLFNNHSPSGVKKTMLVALTSRQIGKSTCIAVFALWASFFNKRPDKRFKSTQLVIVSRGDRQAKKLLKEIRKTYRDGDRFMRETYVDADGKPVFDNRDSTGRVTGYFVSRLSKATGDGNNATSISWRPWDKEKDGPFALGGSRASSSVGCYPPTDTVLGETFTIGFIDEAGHKDIDDDWWFDGMKKTGDANQALWVFTSTPWQPSGFFYDYCDVEGKGNADYVDRVVHTAHALKQDVDSGLHYDDYLERDTAKDHYDYVLSEIEKDIALGKIDSVRRGYLCEFVQGEDIYFDPKKVDMVFKSDLSKVYKYDGPCDLGIDFGAQKSGGSETVLTLSAFIDGRITRLWHRSYNIGTDLQLIDDIESLFEDFNIQRIIPDDCPAGSFLIKEMILKGWNVTPMSFRTWKVKKYGKFRQMLFLEKIDSYDDDELKKQMKGLRNSETSVQSKIIPASGIKDDSIDSFLLSSFHFLDMGDDYEFREW